MRDRTEARLIKRCRAGDPAAWNELFDLHYAPVFRFVFQLGYHLSREDAEEICQECFLSVVRNIHSFKGNAAFQTWLFRIAVNKARDFIEKHTAAKRGGGEPPLSLDAQDPETGLSLDPAAPGPAPDAALLRDEHLAWVHKAVARLGDPCRELIELRYFGELNYTELAVTLGLNPKTVSSRLSRCLDRLEQLVQETSARENLTPFPVQP